MIIKNKNEKINLFLKTDYIDKLEITDYKNNKISFSKELLNTNYYKISFTVNYDTYILINYPKSLILKIGNIENKFIYYSSNKNINLEFYNNENVLILTYTFNDNDIVKNYTFNNINYYYYLYEDINVLKNTSYIKINDNGEIKYFKVNDLYITAPNLGEVFLKDDIIYIGNENLSFTNETKIYTSFEDFNNSVIKKNNCFKNFIPNNDKFKKDIDNLSLKELEIYYLIMDLYSYYLTHLDLLNDLKDLLKNNNELKPFNEYNINSLKGDLNINDVLSLFYKDDVIEVFKKVNEILDFYYNSYIQEKLLKLNSDFKDVIKDIFKDDFIKFLEYIPLMDIEKLRNVYFTNSFKIQSFYIFRKRCIDKYKSINFELNRYFELIKKFF